MTSYPAAAGRPRSLSVAFMMRYLVARWARAAYSQPAHGMPPAGRCQDAGDAVSTTRQTIRAVWRAPCPVASGHAAFLVPIQPPLAPAPLQFSMAWRPAGRGALAGAHHSRRTPTVVVAVRRGVTRHNAAAPPAQMSPKEGWSARTLASSPPATANPVAANEPQPLILDDDMRRSVRMTGFNTPVVLSQELADALMDGQRVMSRTQAASRISAYVRTHNLCPSDNKRVFTLDEKLSALFPSAPAILPHRLITGILRPHILRPDDVSPELQHAVEEYRRNYIIHASQQPKKGTWRKDRRGQHSKAVQMRMQALGRGFFVPVRLSDELAEICGGAKLMPRSEVTKHVWKYIKLHNLQDDKDRRIVHVDAKLRSLCGNIEIVNCFALSKYITRHLTANNAAN
jgi:upstream activation factor subunit UAF30